MTTQELEGIEARARAAAAGPWMLFSDALGKSSVIIPGRARSVFQMEVVPLLPEWCGDYSTNDFIAHARADVPALLEEVRRLKSALEAEREACAKLAAEDCNEPPLCGAGEYGCHRRIAAAIRARGKA